MSFAAPGLLWALLALLPLAALFFLRVKPRKKPTNAFFLWQKVFEDKKSSALFKRMRNILSLILMLLAAAAIVFAMTRPQLEQDDGRDILLIVDVSASMNAGGDGERGIDLARKRAKEIVMSLNGTKRMSVAALSDQVNFLSHFSDSPRDLTRAVNRLRVRDIPVSYEARGTLNQYGKNADETRVILLTDGHGGLDELDPGVEVVRLGEPIGNAGIVATDFEWVSGKKDTAGFFYRVSSSFKEVREAELELRNASTSEILRLIPLKLQPGLSEVSVLEVTGVKAGNWEAILHIEDDFQQDNKTEMVLNEQRQIPVRVFADDSYFYQRSIEAFSRAGGVLGLVSGGSGEIVVSNGKPDGVEPALIFAPSGESPFWSELGDEQEVLVAQPLVEGHPLLAHLSLEGVSFQGARQLTVPERSVVLVESENGLPLIYKTTQEGRVAIVVNLDPKEGEFFLSPWFPVLVHDAAKHLAGREGAWRSVYASGTVIEIPDRAEVTDPAGETHSAGLLPLDQLGHYQLSQDGRDSAFGVSLLNQGESLLNDTGPKESASAMGKGVPPSSWLLLLALIILVAESCLYHRRKLG